MYIVLTFDSLFTVHMLTYVLTKFNTALGGDTKQSRLEFTTEHVKVLHYFVDDIK